MDVTCEQCKAEYDFDDTLLGDKGTTVKCSKCGHVFRVLPPRREPQRSSLKVRFAHDGHIESVASLRELQQRIQQGQVSVDDELGRDGFNYRRLGDVPELKNFFTRPGSSTLPPPSVPAMAAAKAAPKRTVMGLGPGDVPPAPRMPNFGPNAAPQALAPTHPAGVTPQRAAAPNAKATIHGRAPISSAPTAPNIAIPPREAQRPQEQTPLRAQRPQEQTPQRAPQHNLPTPSGTAPTVQASPFGGTATIPAGPAYGAMSADPGRPSTPNPPAQAQAQRPLNTPATPSAPAPRLRIPDSVPPGSLKPPAAAVAQGRAFGGDSIGPGALKAVSQPQPSSAPPAGKGVRLSLEEDELAVGPSREKSSSAKPLLYVGVLLALGGAGWLGASMLSGPTPNPAPSLTPTPEAAPTSAVDAASETANAADAALPEAPDSAAAAVAPSTPEPEPTAAPSAEPTKESATKEHAAKEGAKSDRKEREPAESSSSSREPKDYSGWVSRGEQLFSKGDVSGAKSAFESAIAMRATGSEANSGMGAVLLALGQTREAVPFLTRASNNGFAEASVSLGDAYRKLGEKEDAIEAYETYLARMPKGGRANYVRLQLEGLGRGAKPESNEAPPAAPTTQDYRPAGEVNAPEPAAPKEPAPPANESETTP